VGKWVEVEVWMLLSRHVTSCLAALGAYILIGVAAYWMLKFTRTVGWLPGPTDAWVELVIIYSEFVIIALIFVSSATWFIIDFWKYRKSVSPGGTFFSAFVAA
jgi:cation transporter-like permease